MKIYLNDKFQIIKRDYEDVYKGTAAYTKLEIHAPLSLIEQYTNIYPMYSGRTPSGNEYGDYSFGYYTYSDITEDRKWYDYIDEALLQEEGTIQLTLRMYLKDSNGVESYKVIGNVKHQVFDAVSLHDQILLLNPEAAYNEIQALRSTMRSWLTLLAAKANSSEVTSALALKANDSDVLKKNTPVKEQIGTSTDRQNVYGAEGDFSTIKATIDGTKQDVVQYFKTQLANLIGMDVTSFATNLQKLMTDFDAFMNKSSADDVINSLSEIREAFESRPTSSQVDTKVSNLLTTTAFKNAVSQIIDDTFADVSEEEW